MRVHVLAKIIADYQADKGWLKRFNYTSTVEMQQLYAIYVAVKQRASLITEPLNQSEINQLQTIIDKSRGRPRTLTSICLDALESEICITPKLIADSQAKLFSLRKVGVVPETKETHAERCYSHYATRARSPKSFN